MRIGDNPVFPPVFLDASLPWGRQTIKNALVLLARLHLLDRKVRNLGPACELNVVAAALREVLRSRHALSSKCHWASGSRR
jgi:hypothetical protein